MLGHRPQLAEFLSKTAACCQVSLRPLTLPSVNRFPSVLHLSTLGFTKNLLAPRLLCLSFPASRGWRVFFPSLAGGGNTDPNEWLSFSFSSIPASLALLNCHLSSPPALPPSSPFYSLRIPSYLSEQGLSDSWGPEERKKGSRKARRIDLNSTSSRRRRRKRRLIKKSTREERAYHHRQSFRFDFRFPHWGFFLGASSISVLQCRSSLGWMQSCCKKNLWNGCCAHEWERPDRR